MSELEFAAKEKLEIVLSAPVQGEAGGSGVWGVPPAELRELRSDIFKQTPQNYVLKNGLRCAATHQKSLKTMLERYVDVLRSLAKRLHLHRFHG